MKWQKRVEGAILLVAGHVRACECIFSAEDVPKLEFLLRALDWDNPFVSSVKVPDTIRDAMMCEPSLRTYVVICVAFLSARWYSNRSCADVIKQRGEMIDWIEMKGMQFWCGLTLSMTFVMHVFVFAGKMVTVENGRRMRARRSKISHMM